MRLEMEDRHRPLTDEEIRREQISRLGGRGGYRKPPPPERPPVNVAKALSLVTACGGVCLIALASVSILFAAIGLAMAFIGFMWFAVIRMMGAD